MAIKEPKGRMTKPTPMPKVKPPRDPKTELVRKHWIECYDIMSSKAAMEPAQGAKMLISWVQSDPEKMRFVEIASRRASDAPNILMKATTAYGIFQMALDPTARKHSESDAAD